MPGTIQVSVLGLIDVQTSSPGSSNTSIKVAMGKLEYQTSDSGDYIFYEAPREFDCYSVRC